MFIVGKSFFSETLSKLNIKTIAQLCTIHICLKVQKNAILTFISSSGLTNIISSFEYSLGHLACHMKIRPGQPWKEKENSLKKIDLNTKVKPLTEHIELEDLFGFEIDIFETMETDGEVRINIQAETYFSMGKYCQAQLQLAISLEIELS